MTGNPYRRQFLLTKQASFHFAWKKAVIGGYHLYYHPELEFTHSVNDETELIMLGAIYDWETPAQTNQQLLNALARSASFEKFLAGLSKYSGQYVMIYSDKDNLLLLNDVAAQCEIYYDTSFTTFGSQPKLTGEVVELIPHHHRDAVDFYDSREFLFRKWYVGDTTHVGNIKHLLPNHYIDVNKKSVARYFPSEPVVRRSIKEVAPKVCRMLKGYIKAVAMRKKITMAVTAGYDSRILFLASLDEECKYFVSQHKHMTAKHYDIAIPQQLTKMYGKPFEVIPDAEGLDEVSDSVDFPKSFPKPGKYFDGHVYLMGNISEIARNVYGYHEKLSGKDLSFFGGYFGFPFVAEEYGKWLENATVFRKNGYDVLDMFFWEAKLGVVSAKVKTMMNDLGKDIFSPYSSRDLMVLLLSTSRKDRDYNVNKLYYSILLELSPQALKLPINPCLKLDLIRLATRLKIYNIYRDLGLKYRFLKF